MTPFRKLTWCLICGFLTVLVPLLVLLQTIPAAVGIPFGLLDNDFYHLLVDGLERVGYWTLSTIITIIVSVIYWFIKYEPMDKPTEENLRGGRGNYKDGIDDGDG